MTSYSYEVKLSSGQKEKLARALKNNSAITIRLAKNQLSGPDVLMIKKAMHNIKISESQIRKAVMEGGSLWSSLFSLGTKLLPMATKAVTKAVPALPTGALSGLANVGVDKIFGKGQVGG